MAHKKAGWYDDPSTPRRMRWWDGQAWTDQLSDDRVDHRSGHPAHHGGRPVSAIEDAGFDPAKPEEAVAAVAEAEAVARKPVAPEVTSRPARSALTYSQQDPPTDAAERANWLPAPDGPFYLVTRHYSPRPAILTGEWLPQSTLFVTDRPHDGKRGYWVITPVRINDSAMPVVPTGCGPTPTSPGVPRFGSASSATART